MITMETALEALRLIQLQLDDIVEAQTKLDTYEDPTVRTEQYKNMSDAALDHYRNIQRNLKLYRPVVAAFLNVAENEYWTPQQMIDMLMERLQYESDRT